MPYAYPAPRTGTAQDLLRVVTRAYELELEKSGAPSFPVKTESQRRFVEPLFRLAGIAVGKLVEALPGDWIVGLHDRAFRRLAGGRTYPFDAARPEIVRARALAERLKAETGREPALLALVSHPPVLGALAHLNFELVRHATRALREVRGRPCRPRLVAATDPFALDATAIFEEGFYAGFMGTYHIGIDRLALGRGHLGPELTPQASWTRMPSRLFRVLAAGGEVGLVLAGGVPATSRVLYGAREWLRGARRRSPRRRDPRAVARALEGDESFRRFERLAEDLVRVPSGTWRVVDVWLMAAAAGLLPGETATAAGAAVLTALGIPDVERAALLADLESALTRETPHRRRLFRLLAGRVARARPLVLIPVVHRTEPLGVEIREAWSWERLGRGRVRARRADAADAPLELAPEAFADRFVEENFS
ncbi:MAG: hypothetical protein KGM24_07025 [Elusimicrobia bacterium]|nr:hypothetical protein [Elusimicrobiota bacterium]